MGTSTVQFTVAVSERQLALLELVAEMAARQERDWLAEERREHAGLRGTRLAEARRATRERLALKRESGELAGGRDWLLVPGMQAELVARGWDQKRFRSVPAGALAAGRRWGTDTQRYSAQHDEGETKFLARLGVRLPHELGERLQKAVYWHNADTERKLQEWSEQWGDGPEVILRQSERTHGGVTMLAAMGAALAPTPNEAELQVRAKLREQIVTTGDVIRAALERALAEAPKRARSEHARLSKAAEQAEREAAYAKDRQGEATDKHERAAAAGLAEEAETCQADAASWGLRAQLALLDARQFAQQAASVAELIERLAERDEQPDRPEQLALPEA